jgi:hypothetical protein
VLRWFWSAVGALAAPALASLALRLGFDRKSAFMAGAALALSPTFAHTSHQVLTDAPALAMSIAGLACAAAGQPWRAGVLMAAAMATRETSAIHLVAVVMLPGLRRGALSLVACTISLASIVIVDPPAGMSQWLGAMTQSAQSHPWSFVDLGTALLWVLGAGPVPVIAGALVLARREVNRRVRVVAIPAAIGTALLLFYPDGSFSPRYVLATVPIAFFLAGAPWLAGRTMIAAAALVIPLAGAAIPAARANAVAAQGATLFARIPSLPPDAVVVPGHFCPQARLAAVIAGRPDLRFVCPGWDWPGDVAAELDGALRAGRPVAVDVADAAWVGTREDAPRETVRGWLGSRPSTRAAGFMLVRP